jgi:Protein of unknown function, DUF481
MHARSSRRGPDQVLGLRQGTFESEGFFKIGPVMKIKVVLLISALILTTPLFARTNTDVLVMKNGDRMTCQVKGLDEGVLYVSFDYIDGTASVQWSKVAHLESKQLFIVKTEDGSVYTGTLNTPATPAGQPVKIQVIESPEKEVELDTPKIVGMSETSEKFWQRFNGQLNFGVIYSKGNQSTQYSLGSQAEYLRERWSAAASLSSNLSSSSGTSASTRNLLDLSGSHLLPWNNYFYSGLGSFLQSSAQGITLQTTIGAGVGRYLKNTNQSKISLLGGLAWQGTNYQPSIVPVGNQNLAAAVIALDLNLFRFNKTNLNVTATLLPALSEPGRVRFNANATYYVKLVSNLSWNVSFYGNWDSRPPVGFSGSDYGSSSGVSWTFGLK